MLVGKKKVLQSILFLISQNYRSIWKCLTSEHKEWTSISQKKKRYICTLHSSAMYCISPFHLVLLVLYNCKFR